MAFLPSPSMTLITKKIFPFFKFGLAKKHVQVINNIFLSISILTDNKKLEKNVNLPPNYPN